MRHLFIIAIAVFLCSISGCDTAGPEPEPDPQPKGVGEFIDDWTFRVNPYFPYQNFDIAEFRLWVPDSTSGLRGILVLLNHYNSNGLNLANIPEWQEYAIEKQLGLVGVHFESDPDDKNLYSDAFSGSGDALIKAVDTLAYKHDLQEIKSLPFLLRGYSMGGAFSSSFSAYRPERIIAFANIRGPISSSNEPAVNNIPALTLLGKNDSQELNNWNIDAVHKKRTEGGIWSYAIDPNASHHGNMREADELIKVFFSKALPKRLVEGSNDLAAIPEQSGWLGNNENGEIFSFDSYPESKKDASWLIDEEFANLWQNYRKE